MREEWKQLILDEFKEINVKIDLLTEYTSGTDYIDLHTSEQDRLGLQLFHMSKYSSILQQRINAWRYPEAPVKM